MTLTQKPDILNDKSLLFYNNCIHTILELSSTLFLQDSLGDGPGTGWVMPHCRFFKVTAQVLFIVCVLHHLG